MSRYFRIFEDHDLEGGLTDPPDDLVTPEDPRAEEDLPQEVFWVEMPEDTPWQHLMTGGALLVSETLLGALDRSEEHTSELQSRENLVCRLLLEKKKILNYYL